MLPEAAGQFPARIRLGDRGVIDEPTRVGHELSFRVVDREDCPPRHRAASREVAAAEVLALFLFEASGGEIRMPKGDVLQLEPEHLVHDGLFARFRHDGPRRRGKLLARKRSEPSNQEHARLTRFDPLWKPMGEVSRLHPSPTPPIAMTSRDIKDHIDGQILGLMLSVPKADTRDGTARAVLQALRPYLKKPAGHSLLAGHVSALLKLRRAVLHFRKNEIHIRKQMHTVRGKCPFRLSYDEINNFTKLRYHGLAAKADRRGYWLLTTRGGQFLRGELSIPETVITFANAVAGHTGPLIHISKFAPLVPEFDKLTYTESKPAPRPTQSIFA